MCVIYNSIACLTELKSYLQKQKINDLKSLKEVMNFKNNYSIIRKGVISAHEILIEQEKSTLETELLYLENSIKFDKSLIKIRLQMNIEELELKSSRFAYSKSSNLLDRLSRSFNLWFYKRKIKRLRSNLNNKDNNFVKKSLKLHGIKEKRFQYLISNFEDAVNESCSAQLQDLDRKLHVIEGAQTLILGALGEHKVVKELSKLSDDYILINDFSIAFHPAIYNMRENEYIKTIQIDHLLIAPSGIFMIETKNWSEKSLDSLDLRSPVQQVRRSGFALFQILSTAISCGRVKITNHHWGDKKIPIRNIIVLINTKPIEEFQYVKVLKLNELLGYIRYFKPIFTSLETEEIANYFLTINNLKHIKSK